AGVHEGATADGEEDAGAARLRGAEDSARDLQVVGVEGAGGRLRLDRAGKEVSTGNEHRSTIARPGSGFSRPCLDAAVEGADGVEGPVLFGTSASSRSKSKSSRVTT